MTFILINVLIFTTLISLLLFFYLTPPKGEDSRLQRKIINSILVISIFIIANLFDSGIMDILKVFNK
jgi:hypothetical protein